jgi:hypothetical protein
MHRFFTFIRSKSFQLCNESELTPSHHLLFYPTLLLLLLFFYACHVGPDHVDHIVLMDERDDSIPASSCANEPLSAVSVPAATPIILASDAKDALRTVTIPFTAVTMRFFAFASVEIAVLTAVDCKALERLFTAVVAPYNALLILVISEFAMPTPFWAAAQITAELRERTELPKIARVLTRSTALAPVPTLILLATVNTAVAADVMLLMARTMGSTLSEYVVAA